jgi:hypothetical protein
MLISQAIFAYKHSFLRSKPSYDNVLGTSSLLLLVPPPAKADYAETADYVGT